MFLNYKALPFDSFGNPEYPPLLLETMNETAIGIIPGVYNLKLTVNYSEPSEMEFDVPASLLDEPNPMLDKLTGYKKIRSANYGVYLIMNPSHGRDNSGDVMHIKAYSLEKELDAKRFFIEEGTFKFYNTVDPYDTDTVYGRILEAAPGWNPGSVASSLWDKYRTFEQYDEYLLNFCYNDCKEKYAALFVFDTYQKTINVVNAEDEVSPLPIYLSWDNLIDEIETEELTGEICTCVAPYGADGLSIRDVNPTGSDKIYDLSYFRDSGDFSPELAERYDSWVSETQAARPLYRALISKRAALRSEEIMENVALTELNGEADSLRAQQSIWISALNKETAEGKEAAQARLREINAELAEKEAEIDEKEALIDSIEEELSSVESDITDIVSGLDPATYFGELYAEFFAYVIEQDITDETFVASDFATTSGAFSSLDKGEIVLSPEKSEEISMSQGSKTIAMLKGGHFSVASSWSGDIIRGTIEYGNNQFLLTVYTGNISIGGSSTNRTGTMVAKGTYTNITSDYRLTGVSAQIFITENVSDYERYSVCEELYEFGVERLSELSSPTYEFSLNAGNFIWNKEFKPFREDLELGKGVYLDTGLGVKTPNLIGFQLDFEAREKLSLTFSNRFKRYDSVNTLKEMISKSYSSGRSFNASKHIYNKSVEQSSQVERFMNDALDSARNAIISSKDNTFTLDASGLHIGEGDTELRIVRDMIAFTEDNWNTAKLAVGRFNNGNSTYFGVNAEVIAGKMIVGTQLSIESEGDGAVKSFKFDSSGAWLHNAVFIQQGVDSDYQIMSDYRYGFAGGKNIYTTDGTNVTPSFLDEKGDIIWDSDKHWYPKDTSFFFDIRDGKAYFKGDIYAENGYFKGKVEADSGYFKGELQAASGTFSGSLEAASGTFTGSLQAASGTFTTLTVTESSDSNGLIGPAIYVPTMAAPKFKVDKVGNVFIAGNLKFETGAKIEWNGHAPKYYDDTSWKSVITGTTVNQHYIESPIFRGNEINTYGTFGVYNPPTSETSATIHGVIGYGTGMGINEQGLGTTTDGIALAYFYNGVPEGEDSEGNPKSRINWGTDDANYVIATSEGVRMTCGKYGISLFVGQNNGVNGAYLSTDNGKTFNPLGTGGGQITVTAVWG